MSARHAPGPSIALVDLIYATPWVVGALTFPRIGAVVGYSLIPLFAVSWWQDWKSARAAASYFAARLVPFDVLTAGNYIGLAVSLQWRPAGDSVVNTRTIFHWAAIFLIYIAWNLAIAKDSDAKTRKVFAFFSLAEVPLALIGIGLTTTAAFAWRIGAWPYWAGLSVMAAGHVGLLVAWRLMSRSEDG